MAGSGPDDEWDDPTVATGAPLDAVRDEITKPHDLGPILQEARQAGCEACYAEGQADALIALRSLLYEKGAPADEVDAVLSAVRARLVRL